MVRFAPLAATAAAAFLLSATPALATRYASPSGPDTATCADPAHACSIETAIAGHGANKPNAGEEISLAAGEYDVGAALHPAAESLNVHGPAPDGTYPPPSLAQIHSAANDFSHTLIDSSLATKLTDVWIYGQVNDEGGVLDRVLIVTSGQWGCQCWDGLIRDSLIISTTAGDTTGGGVGYVGDDPNATEDLRNDTILGGPAPAVRVGYTNQTTSSGGPQFTLENTIASAWPPGSGGAVGIAVGQRTSTQQTSVTLHHSDYVGTDVTNGATLTATDADLTTPPGLAAPEANNALVAGSPEIDAGLNDPADGTLDFLGAPRTQGASTDIGAYEYQPPPPLIAEQAPTATNVGVTLPPLTIAQPKLKLYPDAGGQIIDRLSGGGTPYSGSIYARCTGVTLTCKVSGKLRDTISGHRTTVGSITGNLKPNHKLSLTIKLTSDEYLTVYHAHNHKRTVSASITTTAGATKVAQSSSITLDEFPDYSAKHRHTSSKPKHRS